jgi:hypothetical protein
MPSEMLITLPLRIASPVFFMAVAVLWTSGVATAAAPRSALDAELDRARAMVDEGNLGSALYQVLRPDLDDGIFDDAKPQERQHFILYFLQVCRRTAGFPAGGLPPGLTVNRSNFAALKTFFVVGTRYLTSVFQDQMHDAPTSANVRKALTELLELSASRDFRAMAGNNFGSLELEFLLAAGQLDLEFFDAPSFREWCTDAITYPDVGASLQTCGPRAPARPYDQQRMHDYLKGKIEKASALASFANDARDLRKYVCS